LPGLYSGALAVVYPSLYEGFGLPVLEAMQCGSSVIASRAVEEAGGGAAVYAEGAAEMAGAMRAIVERPEWNAGLRARSLEHARSFTWERAAEQTREVYEEARRRFAR
jgi:glycosyltransferase involved in cell wall biosynthesis